METVFIILLVIFIVIILIPTTEDIKKYNNRCLDIHKWETIQVPEVNGCYLRCSECKYKPETEMEEPTE